MLPGGELLTLRAAGISSQTCRSASMALSCKALMLVVMRDGKAIETGTVGREGIVGAMSGIAPCSGHGHGGGHGWGHRGGRGHHYGWGRGRGHHYGWRHRHWW
jgi:hypothetical protein